MKVYRVVAKEAIEMVADGDGIAEAGNTFDEFMDTDTWRVGEGDEDDIEYYEKRKDD